MAIPANVKTHLDASIAVEGKRLLQQSRNNIASAGNLARHIAVKKIDELQPAESRAVQKVLALP